MIWQTIESAISAATGETFRLENQAGIGGGCINSAMKISGAGHEYFVKLNRRSLLDMFEAEAEGLRELAAADTVRVPQAVCTGIAQDQAYIVMEYISLNGAGHDSMTRFGEQLAQMHRYTHERYGWYRDNTIGSTPQKNNQSDDWVSFWHDQRLGEQLRLGRVHGLSARVLDKGERLQSRLPDFLSSHTPPASVLHGDLWSGNYAFSDKQEPVIFDPAVYFGDRETDLAMTELFGGFGREFYAAYNATWPLDAGYAQRKVLYNLYHILNHFNLFGSGYAGQAESMIDSLLAELG